MDSTSETAKNEESAEHALRFVRGDRELQGAKKEMVAMSSVRIAADWIRNVIDNSREHVAALYLDGAHKLIGYAVVATGTANTCLLHPRKFSSGPFCWGPSPSSSGTTIRLTG